MNPFAPIHRGLALSVCLLCVLFGSTFASGADGGGGVETSYRPLGLEPHPYTTEPGRFIIEVTPIAYAYDRRNPEGARRRVDTFSVGALLKYGLTTNLDLQVGVDLFTWERERDRDAGERETRRGFGDLTLRGKYNVAGNDEGDFALALMPFLVLPSGTGGVGEPTIRGGLMVPTALALMDRVEIAWTPSFAAVPRAGGSGHAFEFASLLALGVEVLPWMAAVLEFESSVTSERGEPWVGAVGAALTFELDEHTQIEPLVSFGVTRSAPDVTFELALVRRF